MNTLLKTALNLRCSMPIDAFRHMGDTIDTPDGPLTWIDRGGDVLAVAHLDYVMWSKPRMSKTGDTIRCPQLDDRLGVWTILDYLPTLGVRCDVLLTDSEERGRSTARYFDSPKQYNWMFQFDRHGTETVLYDYDSDENRARLIDSGLSIGRGSFSDICYLEHLGISGWNVGTGYYREHSKECFARLFETRKNAQKFSEFWRAHQGELIPAPDLSYADYLLDYDRERYREKNRPRYHSLNVWECECGEMNWREDDYCDDCGMPYEYREFGSYAVMNDLDNEEH